MKDESESSLLAYLVFKALVKQAAVAFSPVLGNTKLFPRFTLLLMLQGADTQESPKPYLSSPRGSTEFGFPNKCPKQGRKVPAGLGGADCHQPGPPSPGPGYWPAV